MGSKRSPEGAPQIFDATLTPWLTCPSKALYLAAADSNQVPVLCK